MTTPLAALGGCGHSKLPTPDRCGRIVYWSSKSTRRAPTVTVYNPQIVLVYTNTDAQVVGRLSRSAEGARGEGRPPHAGIARRASRRRPGAPGIRTGARASRPSEQCAPCHGGRCDRLPRAYPNAQR